MRGSVTFIMLASAGLFLGGFLAVAGERAAGDVCMERESLNACGASFSAAGDVEIGWTIGQHGSFSEGTAADLDLQGGLWAEPATPFAGTVFMFL